MSGIAALYQRPRKGVRLKKHVPTYLEQYYPIFQKHRFSLVPSIVASHKCHHSLLGISEKSICLMNTPPSMFKHTDPLHTPLLLPRR